MKKGYVNEIFPIELQLNDGATGKYPRVYIYKASDNTLLDNLPMGPGNAYGTYVANYTPTTAQHLYMVFRVFTSNLYNTLDEEYTIEAESALIENRQTMEEDIAEEVWTYANRTLTAPVDVNGLDPSELATTQDVEDAKNEILDSLNVWEVKGAVAIDKLTDTLELVTWLTKNGETVMDANSAQVEMRDGDDNLIFVIATPDTSISPVAGLFKFNRGGASAIILKNKTYVMKSVITRGAQTFRGNVSISTY